MPVLNIGGQRVRVGDEFLSLLPDMQNQTVDEIARSLPRGSVIEAPIAAASGTSGPWERYQAQSPSSIASPQSAPARTFEIQDRDGSTYEVQAPDEQSAVNGFKQYNQKFYSDIPRADFDKRLSSAPAAPGFTQPRGGSAMGSIFGLGGGLGAGTATPPPGFVLDRSPDLSKWTDEQLIAAHKPGSQPGNPIQVQGPDGAIIEFPHGTPQGVMEGALRKHYGGLSAAAGTSSDLPPGFVLDPAAVGRDQERVRRLETALINADKAGDPDAAKTLAAAITRIRQAGSSTDGPWNKYRDVGMATAAGRGVAQGFRRKNISSSRTILQIKS